MKTIKSLKGITTLEVGDEVVFGNLVYKVRQNLATVGYYLYLNDEDTPNDTIFKHLKVNKRTFIENIGIKACIHMDFPETKSLVALTAIVSALFKEYEKQKELPKTWEEFCNKYPITPEKEAFINTASRVMVYKGSRITRLVNDDRNLCISKQEAEAFIALMQLRQLRKAYVKDWEPNWMDDISIKYCIEVANGNAFLVHSWYHKSHILSFPSRKLAEQFLTNFKDLLEIAKPLL